MEKRSFWTQWKDSADVFKPGKEEIAEKWSRLYFHCAMIASCFVTLFEILFFFILYDMSEIQLDVACYFLKYMLLPTAASWMGILLHYLLSKSLKSAWAKACSVSVLYVWITFVIYTVHMRFNSLNLIFALVIFMTVIYGDGKLTTVISAVAIGAKVVSDFFLIWDSGMDWRLHDTDAVLEFVVALVALVGAYLVSLVIIWIEREKYRMSTQLEMEKLRLYEETLTDSLSGIGNRNALRAALDRMAARPEGNNRDILVMLDIDYFKEINDLYGHLVGDRYIQLMGRVLRSVHGAEAFRFGGDEFCLLFQESNRETVLQACEVLQKQYWAGEVCSEYKYVTISCGAAEYDRAYSLTELVRRADSALYQAKEKRGSVSFYTGEDLIAQQ